VAQLGRILIVNSGRPSALGRAIRMEGVSLAKRPSAAVASKPEEVQRESASTKRILAEYDVGVRVGHMDGVRSLAQIADDLKQPGGANRMSALCSFAKAFKREFVAEWCGKAASMKNGKPLELSHWIRLARIENREEAKKMLKQTIEKGLTVRDLDEAIRSGKVKGKNTRTGGRSPQVPANPVAAIERAATYGRRFAQYMQQAKEMFAANADSGGFDNVERIESAIAVANQVVEQACTLKFHLDRLKRLSNSSTDANGRKPEPSESNSAKRRDRSRKNPE